jgi:hypothetical protein
LKGETESEIVTAQDQVLQTNIIQQKYYKQKQQMQIMLPI